MLNLKWQKIKYIKKVLLKISYQIKKYRKESLKLSKV